MIVKEVVSDILLGLAVLIVLTSAIGVLVMRDAYQKLHFVSPAGLVAPALVALAVMVLALLAQGFQRPSLFELPVVLAVLLFGSGLVFIRALERWL